jgi:6-phosphogluconate dehydrogenase (decarboxylating)
MQIGVIGLGCMGNNIVGRLLGAGHRCVVFDTLIDCGNSFYKDDIRRAANLGAKNIRYLDVGTNGGAWGFERRSLYTSFRSRQTHTFGEKLLSAMRNKFGGHVEPGKRK